MIKEVDMKGLGFHGQIPNMLSPKSYRNLLVSLNDVENFVITLGIVRSIDSSQMIMVFNSPQFDHLRVASITFGSIHLDLEGKQIYL